MPPAALANNAQLNNELEWQAVTTDVLCEPWLKADTFEESQETGASSTDSVEILAQSAGLLNEGFLNNKPERQAKTTDVSHKQRLKAEALEESQESVSITGTWDPHGSQRNLALREFKQEKQLRVELHDFSETELRGLLAAFHGNCADLLHEYRTKKPMLKLMLDLPDFNKSQLETLLEAFNDKVEDLKCAFYADKTLMNLMLVLRGFNWGELQVLLEEFQRDHAELKRQYFTNASTLKAILDEKAQVEIPEERFELPGFTEDQVQILLVLSDGDRDSLKDVYLRRSAVLHYMLSTNQTLELALEVDRDSRASTLKAILDEKAQIEIPEERFELPGFTEDQVQILLVLSDGDRDSLKDVYLRRSAVLHYMLSTNQTLELALEVDRDSRDGRPHKTHTKTRVPSILQKMATLCSC